VFKTATMERVSTRTNYKC